MGINIQFLAQPPICLRSKLKMLCANHHENTVCQCIPNPQRHSIYLIRRLKLQYPAHRILGSLIYQRLCAYQIWKQQLQYPGHRRCYTNFRVNGTGPSSKGNKSQKHFIAHLPIMSILQNEFEDCTSNILDTPGDTRICG